MGAVNFNMNGEHVKTDATDTVNVAGLAVMVRQEAEELCRSRTEFVIIFI